MTNGRIEEQGFVRVPYLIRYSEKIEKYEWVLRDLNAESDEWFETIGDARKDVQSYFE